MKRLFVAAGLAVAAMSLPATAALADGYEHRQTAKPKPKPQQLRRKAPRRAHAPAHHRQERVRDFGAVYCCERSHASYSLEQFESVETSYFEESSRGRIGPVVSYRESYINPARGCLPHAPCGYATGPQVVYGGGHGASFSGGGAHLGQGFHHGGHPGGVGYGVDGGYAGTVFVVPGGGFRSHHAHGAMSRSATTFGGSHGYYGGQGFGVPGAAYPPRYGHPGFPMPGAHGPGHGAAGHGGMVHHFNKPGR